VIKQQDCEQCVARSEKSERKRPEVEAFEVKRFTNDEDGQAETRAQRPQQNEVRGRRGVVSLRSGRRR